MRVITKFALATFLASLLCLGGMGWVAAKRSVSRIDASVEVDVRSFGASLRRSFEQLWRSHGREAAMSFLANASGGDVAIQWSSAPSPRDEAEVRVTGVGDGRTLTLSLPVRGGDERGVLLLSRVLPSEGAIFREELRDELVAASSMGVFIVGLAVALGGLLIGRPLRRIVDQTKRIGASDFSQRLREDRNDEIGELKRAFNRMSDDIVAARGQLEAEATARVELLEELRHLDRLRTVATIAASMAHELGTPLNVVLIRAQSLVPGKTTAEQSREIGETITRQVERMSQIVRRLLDLSRRETPGRTPLQLDQVARDAKDLLLGIAKKHKVDLVVEATASPLVLADRSELEQVLSNLVVNSVQAMPRGGTVRLRVEAAEAKLEAGRGSPALAALVSVIDEGSGMSPASLEHIFDPFFTTKAPGVGTGLGLAVARGIVEELGGTLSATSVEGGGTTIRVALPLHRPSLPSP